MVSFAGDAVLCVWPCNKKEELSGVALRAAQCCQNMMADPLLTHFPIISPDGDETYLTYHVGVGLGHMTGLVVGNGSQYKYFLVGDAVYQCTVMCTLGKNGEFVLSPEAYEVLWQLTHEFCPERSTGESSALLVLHHL